MEDECLQKSCHDSFAVGIRLANISGGCAMASRNFVRNKVNTSSDALSARIDKDDGQIGEVKDGVDRVNGKVTQMNGQISQLDATTNEHGQRIDSLKGNVDTLGQQTAQAKTTADQASSQVTTLAGKFDNRNQFTVTSTKSVLFKFDSAALDSKYKGDLDDVAEYLSSNPNAIMVLEGRTDSAGDKNYNVQLAERRIEKVKLYLAFERSVQIYRIHELSMGSDHPVSANNSREGREQNRAVVLTVLVPANGTGSD